MVIASMFSYALAVYFFTLQPVYSLDCALGTYQSPQNAETCVDCPAGRWSDVQGLTASFQCKYCVAGRYSLESGKQDDTHCKACDKGRYADHRGSVECSNCTAGRYAPNVGTVVCEACSGTVVDRTSCLAECEIGYEFQTKDNVCLDCPPGSHPVNGVCLDCPVGRFSDISGSTACVQCPAGYLSSETRDSCGFCQPGQYQDALTNVLSCTSCEPGRHQPDTGKTVCLGDLCPQGQFGTLGNVAECYECIPGRFQADTGQTECELCPSGQHQRNVGFNICDDCPANTMGSSSNSAKGQIECGAGCPAGAECSPIEMTTTLPWHQVGVSEFHLDLGTDPNATVAELTKDSNVSYSVNIGGWNDAYNVFDGVKRNVYCEYVRFYSKWSCSDLKPFNWEWEKYICQDCYSYKDLYGNVHHELQAWLQNRSFEVDTSTLDYESLPMSVNTWARKTFYKPDLRRTLRVVSTRAGRRDETHAPVPIKVFKTLFEPEGSGSSIADAMEGMSKDTELAAGTQQLTSDYTFNLHAGTKTNKGYTVVKLPFGNTYSGGQINDIDTFVNELRNIMTRFTIERKYNVITFVVKKETNGVPYNIRVDSCDIGSILVQGACAFCTVGKYGTEGATVCTECGTGLYQNEQGESSCKTCPPGTESKNKNTRDCANCPVGKYSDNSILFCEFCPKGYYQVDPAQLQCLKCSANTYGDETGLKSVEECKQCPAGSISEEASVSTTDCAFRPDCPVGKYLSPRQDGCVKCPPGRYSNVTGLTKVGQLYQPLTQEEKACTGCPSGYFQDEHGQTSCKATSAGYYEPDALEISDEAVDKDHPCPKGRYSSATGLASVDDCTKCPKGYFQEETSATSCKICELGKQSDIVGSKSKDWCEMCPSGQYSNVLGAHGHAFPSVKFEFLDGDLKDIDISHMNRVVRGSRQEQKTALRNIYWRQAKYRFTPRSDIGDMFKCNSSYTLTLPNGTLTSMWFTKRVYNAYFNGVGSFDDNINDYFMRHVSKGHGSIDLPFLPENNNKVHFNAYETSVVYTFDLHAFLESFNGTYFPPPFEVNMTLFKEILHVFKNNTRRAAFEFFLQSDTEEYGLQNYALVKHPKHAPAGIFVGAIMKFVPVSHDTDLDTQAAFFNKTYSYDIRLYRKVYLLKTWNKLVTWTELGEDAKLFLPPEFNVMSVETQYNLDVTQIVNQSIPEKPDGSKWYKLSSSGYNHLLVSNNEENLDDIPYLTGETVEDLTLFPEDAQTLLNQLNYFDRGRFIENDYLYTKEAGEYDGSVSGNGNFHLVAQAKRKGPNVRTLVDIFDWKLIDNGVHKPAIYSMNETLSQQDLQQLLVQNSNYTVCFDENVTEFDVYGLDFSSLQRNIGDFLESSVSLGFEGSIEGNCVHLHGNVDTPGIFDDSLSTDTNVYTHTPMFKVPELPVGFQQYNTSKVRKSQELYLKGYFELAYLKVIEVHAYEKCIAKLIEGEQRLKCKENLQLPDDYELLTIIQQSVDAYRKYELTLTDDDVLYKFEDNNSGERHAMPCCDICDNCPQPKTVSEFVTLTNASLLDYEVSIVNEINGLFTVHAIAYGNGNNIVPLTEYSENNDIDIEEVISGGRHSHRQFPFITLASETSQKHIFIDQQYNSSEEIYDWMTRQTFLTDRYDLTYTYTRYGDDIQFDSKTSGEADMTIDCCLSDKDTDDEQMPYVFDIKCERFQNAQLAEMSVAGSNYALILPPIYNLRTLVYSIVQDQNIRTYWSCKYFSTYFDCTAKRKGPEYSLTLSEVAQPYFDVARIQSGTTNNAVTSLLTLENLIHHVKSDLQDYNVTSTQTKTQVDIQVDTPALPSQLRDLKDVYGMRREFEGPSFINANNEKVHLVDSISNAALTGQTLYDSIDKTFVSATLTTSVAQYYEPEVMYPYVFEKPLGFNVRDYYFQCREIHDTEDIECTPYLNFVEYDAASSDFFYDKAEIKCSDSGFSDMPFKDAKLYLRFYFDLTTCRGDTIALREAFIKQYDLVSVDDPEWDSNDGEKFSVRYKRLDVDNIHDVRLHDPLDSSSITVKRFHENSVSSRCLHAPRYIYNNNFDNIYRQLLTEGAMTWIEGSCNDFTRKTIQECRPQIYDNKGCCPSWEPNNPNWESDSCWPAGSPHSIFETSCGKMNWINSTEGGYCPDGTNKPQDECKDLDLIWTEAACYPNNTKTQNECEQTSYKYVRPIHITLYSGRQFIIRLDDTNDAKEKIQDKLTRELFGIYDVLEENGRLYLEMSGDIRLQNGIRTVYHGDQQINVEHEYQTKPVTRDSDYMEFFAPEDERSFPCTTATMKQTDKFTESNSYITSLPNGRLLLRDINEGAGLLPGGYVATGVSDTLNVLTLEQPPYYKITPKCLGCSDSQRPTATKHECEKCSDGSNNTRQQCVECSNPNFLTRNTCVGCSDDTDKTYKACISGCSDGSNKNRAECLGCSDGSNKNRAECLWCSDGSDKTMYECAFCSEALVWRIQSEESCLYDCSDNVTRRTNAQIDCSGYVKTKANGDCTHKIYSKVECEAAARFYSLNDTTAEVVSRTDWLSGCYFAWNGQLYFNTAASDIACGTDDNECLCRKHKIQRYVLCDSNKRRTAINRVCEHKITAEAECEAAARYYRLNDTTAEVVSRTDWLSGCYFAWNGQLYFNTAASDIACGRSNENQCLCLAGKENKFVRNDNTWGPTEGRTWGSREERTWGPDESRTWGPEESRTWGADSNRTWGADNGHTWGADNGHTWGPIVSTSQQNCSGTWYPVENFNGYIVMQHDKLDWKKESRNIFANATAAGGTIFLTPYNAHIYATEEYRTILEPMMFEINPGQMAKYYKGFSKMDIDQCHMCAPGQYQDEIGRTSCKLAGKGQYVSSWGEAVMTPAKNDCPAGTYGVSTGTDNVEDCRSCSPGMFQNEQGQTSCYLCPMGRYTNVVKSGACTYCAVGTYQNERGASECKECPLGKIATNEGSEQCQHCPKGKYVDDDAGVPYCADCKAGFRCPIAGMLEPYMCAPGTYAAPSHPVKMLALSGQNVITYNVQNYDTYRNDPPNPNLKSGSVECAKCIPGFYQDEYGQSECKKHSFREYEGAKMSLEQLCWVCDLSTTLIRANDKDDCVSKQGTWRLKNADESPPGTTLTSSSAVDECAKLTSGGFLVNRAPPEFQQQLDNAKILFTRSPRYYPPEQVKYYKWDDEYEECFHEDGHEVPQTVATVYGTIYLDNEESCKTTVSDILSEPVCIRDTYVRFSEGEGGVPSAEYNEGNETTYSVNLFITAYNPSYAGIPIRYLYYGIDNENPCNIKKNNESFDVCTEGYNNNFLNVESYEHPHTKLLHAKIKCEDEPGIAEAEEIWNQMSDFERINSVAGQDNVVPHAWTLVDPRTSAAEGKPPKSYVGKGFVLNMVNTAPRGRISYDGVTVEDCPTWGDGHWKDFENVKRKVFQTHNGEKFFFKFPGGECQLCPLGFYAVDQVVPGSTPALREETYNNGGYCGIERGATSFSNKEYILKYRDDEGNIIDEAKCNEMGYKWQQTNTYLWNKKSPCSGCQPGTFMPEGEQGRLEVAHWDGNDYAMKCNSAGCTTMGGKSNRPAHFGRYDYFRTREAIKPTCTDNDGTVAFNDSDKAGARTRCTNAGGTYKVEWYSYVGGSYSNGYWGSQTMLRNMYGGKAPDGFATYFSWQPSSIYSTRISTQYPDGKSIGHSCHLCPPGHYESHWGQHTTCSMCQQDYYDNEEEKWTLVPAETERYGVHWMGQQGTWACKTDLMLYQLFKWAGKFFTDYARPLLSGMIFNTLVGMPAQLMVEASVDSLVEVVTDEYKGYSKGKKYCTYIKGVWDLPAIGGFLNYLHSNYEEGRSVGVEFLSKLGTDNAIVDAAYEGCQIAGSKMRKTGAGTSKMLGLAMEVGCGLKPQLNHITSKRWFTGRGYDSHTCAVLQVQHTEYGYWDYVGTKQLETLLKDGDEIVDGEEELLAEYEQYGNLEPDEWESIFVHPHTLKGRQIDISNTGTTTLLANSDFLLLAEDDEAAAQSSYPYAKGCDIKYFRDRDGDAISEHCGQRTIAKCKKRKVIRCGLDNIDAVNVGIKPNFPTPTPLKVGAKLAVATAETVSSAFKKWKSGAGMMLGVSLAQKYVSKSLQVGVDAFNNVGGTWEPGKCTTEPWRTKETCDSVAWNYFATGYCEQYTELDLVAVTVDKEIDTSAGIISWTVVEGQTLVKAFDQSTERMIPGAQKQRCDKGNDLGCNIYYFTPTYVEKVAYRLETVCYNKNNLNVAQKFAAQHFSPAVFWMFEHGMYKNPSACSMWNKLCTMEQFLAENELDGVQVGGEHGTKTFRQLFDDEYTDGSEYRRGSLENHEETNCDALTDDKKIERQRYSRKRYGKKIAMKEFLQDLDDHQEHVLAYMVHYRECVTRGYDWKYVPVCMEKNNSAPIGVLDWDKTKSECESENYTVGSGHSIEHEVITPFCLGDIKSTKKECGNGWVEPRCIKGGSVVDGATECDCTGSAAACYEQQFKVNEDALIQNPIAAETAKVAVGLRNSIATVIGKGATLFSFASRPNTEPGEKSWSSVAVPFWSSVLSKGAGQVRKRSVSEDSSTTKNEKFEFEQLAIGLNSNLMSLVNGRVKCAKAMFKVISEGTAIIKSGIDGDVAQATKESTDLLMQVFVASLRCDSKTMSKGFKKAKTGLKKLFAKKLVGGAPKKGDMSLEGGYGSFRADCWEFYVDENGQTSDGLQPCGTVSPFNLDPYEADASDDDTFDDV